MDKQCLRLFAKWLYENNCFSGQAIDPTFFDLQDALDLVERFVSNYEQSLWKPSGLLAKILSFRDRQNLTSEQYRSIWQDWLAYGEQLNQKGLIPACLSNELSQELRSNYLMWRQIQDFTSLKGYQYKTRCDLVYNFAKVVMEEIKAIDIEMANNKDIC